MTVSNGSIERLTPTDDKLEETRRAIAEHEALPLGRRIVRRLTGNYPPFEDRYKLAQHELSPFYRIKHRFRFKTFLPGGLGDRPPFMDYEESKYHKMATSSDWLFTSRYVSIRCNPVAAELIEAADDRRVDSERVDDPWYIGLYRQVMPREGLLRRKQINLGVYLTDKAGVQFEAIDIDEALVESMPEDSQRELAEFVADMPVPAYAKNPYATAASL